ncbi:MAG: hypothetical protein NTZ09_18560 [Candidatus Hydrogenedentes bacterium]|nr:hypothetical protein [Candidatus Hydrogenedentota bacterium]
MRAVLFLSPAACAVEAPSVEQLKTNPDLLQQLYEPAKTLTVQEYKTWLANYVNEPLTRP